MSKEEECGCGGHHAENSNEEQGKHGEDCRCGCGGHGSHPHHAHHGMNQGFHHHEGCNCGCHQQQSGEMSHGHECGCGRHGHLTHRGFRRQFISRGEVISRLEDYLKELKAETKGVEEHIAELNKEDETKQK
jgi:hypothetical protein